MLVFQWHTRCNCYCRQKEQGRREEGKEEVRETKERGDDIILKKRCSDI